MSSLGAYSNAIVLARPDGRSKEARLLRKTRDVYAAYLGGWEKLTPPQRTLIERIAMLQLRVAKLDEKMLSGNFSEFDVKQYLAWSNSLVRALRELGVTPLQEGQAADPLDRLANHLRGNAA